MLQWTAPQAGAKAADSLPCGSCFLITVILDLILVLKPSRSAWAPQNPWFRDSEMCDSTPMHVPNLGWVEIKLNEIVHQRWHSSVCDT